MRYLQILIFSFLTVFAYGQLPDYTFEADSCTLTWVEDGTDTIHTWDLQSLVWGASSSMAIHWTDASGTAGSGDIMRFPAFATNQDAFDYLDSVKTVCVDLMAATGYWEEGATSASIQEIAGIDTISLDSTLIVQGNKVYITDDGTTTNGLFLAESSNTLYIGVNDLYLHRFTPTFTTFGTNFYVDGHIQSTGTETDLRFRQKDGTSGFLFQNSAGTDLVEIDPDGDIDMGGEIQIKRSGAPIGYANLFVESGHGWVGGYFNNNKFRVRSAVSGAYIDLFGSTHATNASEVHIDADAVGIGTTSPSTTLEVNGGLTWNTTSSGAGNYTVLVTDYIILKSAHTGGGTDDVILPSTAATGQVFNIKDSDGSSATNNFDITTAGAELIDGAASLTISTNYANIKVVFDGTNYLIL